MANITEYIFCVLNILLCKSDCENSEKLDHRKIIRKTIYKGNLQIYVFMFEWRYILKIKTLFWFCTIFDLKTHFKNSLQDKNCKSPSIVSNNIYIFQCLKLPVITLHIIFVLYSPMNSNDVCIRHKCCLPIYIQIIQYVNYNENHILNNLI